MGESYTDFKEFTELNNQCEPNYGFNNAIIRSNENNFENYGFTQQENLPNNDPNNILWQKSEYGFNTNFELKFHPYILIQKIEVYLKK